MPGQLWAILVIGVCLSAAQVNPEETRRRGFSAYSEDLVRPEPSPVRQEVVISKQPAPQCPSKNYEPLLSFGSYFLARISDSPRQERSPIVPYTKNATLLLSALAAFCFGLLLGVVLTVCTLKRKTGIDQETLTEDLTPDGAQEEVSNDDQAVTTPQPIRGAVYHLKALNLDDAESDTEPALGRPAHAVDSDAECEIAAALEDRRVPYSRTALVRNREITSGALTETERLCDCIQQLQQTIHETNQPLNIIAKVTKSIANSLYSLTHLTHWLAWRKARKDLWTQAKDNMSHGILIMNLTLGVAACLFGRWQDWGLQCGLTRFSWSIHSLMAICWCWVEEPFIFVLGCLLWWAAMRFVSSSNFLKRKHALSTPLLLLTFLCAGMAQSFVVSLLGGAWSISFTLWILYSMFLIQTLDSARAVLTPGHLKSSNQLFAVSHGGWNACLSVFVFPVLAGALPFWNAGLSLLLFSKAELCAEWFWQQFESLSDGLREYLLY